MTTQMSPIGVPLDSSPSERKALASAAVELIEHLLERRISAPIFVPTPQELIDNMLKPPAERGAQLLELFSRLQSSAECGWSKLHGGDLAFIPSGGIYSGAIAALLASGVHAFTGAAFESPALVALEEGVLRWLAELMMMPPGAEGLLLSGGSLANQTAIVCAREQRAFDAGSSIVYLSERAHHSLHKALHLCGIPSTCVRSIATNAQFRIDIGALRCQVDEDVAAGFRPWLLIGVAGSTDTGSIDELDALGAVASEHGMWFHVDAAYGGLFALTTRGNARLRGIGAADSITVDAHKGLMLPYGVAALLVRSPGVLAQAHSGRGAYMRDVPHMPALPHYFERGPELTRPFRGLLLWLPLHLHGVAAFRDALDSALDLAAGAASKLRAVPGVEVMLEPELSIVAFRAQSGDADTEQALAAINSSGRFHVSSTTLGSRTAIRLAFLHPRTTESELDDVVQIVCRVLTRVQKR
jgi:aromatic-L-amino-acid/L-tryptophan decarboxylase